MESSDLRIKEIDKRILEIEEEKKLLNQEKEELKFIKIKYNDSEDIGFFQINKTKEILTKLNE